MLPRRNIPEDFQTGDHAVERLAQLAVILPGGDEEGVDDVVIGELAGEQGDPLLLFRHVRAAGQDQGEGGRPADGVGSL